MSLDVSLNEVRKVSVFNLNITHNLNEMAEEAGIYKALWRPEEIGIKYARDLIALLEAGLARLLEKPEYYRMYNPVNGWGNYDNLIEFTQDYLDACIMYPDSEIEVSR